MDPASVIGVIGVVAQITQAIYAYGDAVGECRTEVAQLRCELFGMQAALTQMQQDLTLLQKNGGSTAAAPSSLHAPQCRAMLHETRLVLEKLADTLEAGTSRSDRLVKRLVWPLKRPHVQALATHLERLKTFFILVVTRDGLQAAQEMQRSVDALGESVQAMQQTQQEQSVYLDAMAWLAPCDPSVAHATASACRLAGTNAWFLDDTFQAWAASAESVLWLKGKPGSGKTCLVSACADRLLQADCIVAYFYCSYNDASSQQPQSILGSLLAQLCRQRPTARHAVLAAYQASKARNSLHDLVQVPMLLSLLQTATAPLSSRVFFLVDAANECGDALAAALDALFQVAVGGRVRLMLSSTESVAQTIRDRIARHGVPAREVHLDPASVGRDIDAYITARFAREAKLQRLRPDLQRSLVATLQGQHQGSFRWTRCTVDDLLRRATPRAIRRALDGVAATLGDIYLAILRGVPRELAGAARAMLQYLVASMRPLTLAELGEAASLVVGDDDFGEDDRLIEPEAVVHALHSLVHCGDAGGSSQRVELAHSSVRTFLTTPDLSGPYCIDPADANGAMVRACLYYLALPPFRQPCADAAALAARKRAWPLLEYAACFWTRHARRSSDSDADSDYLALFAAFAASDGHFAAWYQCVHPTAGRAALCATRPLYMCAREGLLGPLRLLLAPEELERRGGARGSTPLHVAATYGEVGAVRLLLAAGADPRERNDFGESGLQWAAFWGHAETVRVLLEAGAEPDLLTYRGAPELRASMVLHSQAASARHAGAEDGDAAALDQGLAQR